MKLKNILDNLYFKNIKLCSNDEINDILKIRNENNIRRNSVSKNKITMKEHISWVNKIKNSKINNFYAIKYKNNTVGGLALNNYDQKLLLGEWSFYISEKNKFIGLGASIEFKSIEYFFNFYNLNTLFCYVLKHNLPVLKLHKKFGFEEILFDKYYKDSNIKNIVSENVYYALKKYKWNMIKDKIYKLYF